MGTFGSILCRYREQENRRPHPLSPDGKRSLTKCIAEERELLESLRGEADIVIDTSETAARQLKEKLGELFLNSPDDDEISISLTSFGFKYGLPSDADMVIDVRFLPNPYYVPELKALCGLDGVEQAHADHEKNEAVVSLSKEVPDDALRKAVEDKDYKVTDVI